MFRLLAGLTRSLPAIVALIIIAVIIYFVVSWRASPNRAKSILIRLFTVIMSGACVFFALATVYALIDNNPTAAELALTFLIPGAVGLAVTLICRALFIRHHPHYRKRPTPTTYESGQAWKRLVAWLIGR